jgi:hypothetical protein
MQSVKVRRSDITADVAADVLQRELGADYEVSADLAGTLLVRKGFARAKVTLRAEPGGTVFEVNGAGVSFFPLISFTSKALNDKGIARQTASAIGEAEAFRDDS